MKKMPGRFFAKIPVYECSAIFSQDTMITASGAARLLGMAFAKFLVIALVLPLIPAILFGFPLTATFALLTTGFVIEYGAAPVGILLGLSPVFVFYALMCTEIALFLCLFDIFDTIGNTSAPVSRFLERTHAYIHKSRIVEKYGILSLIPSEIIIGVYFNAPASWVLGWQKDNALVVTIAGYCVALAATILATIGLIGMYFPKLV